MAKNQMSRELVTDLLYFRFKISKSNIPDYWN